MKRRKFLSFLGKATIVSTIAPMAVLKAGESINNLVIIYNFTLNFQF